MKGSVSDWAKKHGISRQAAYKRLNAHGIKVVAGKIDLKKADAIWNSSKNTLQEARGTGRLPKKKPSGTHIPRSGISSLGATQLRREQIRLERETIELAALKGEYVEVVKVNLFVSGMILRVKELLLQVGPELRERVARESDPKRCEQLISQEIRGRLAMLAEYQHEA